MTNQSPAEALRQQLEALDIDIVLLNGNAVTGKIGDDPETLKNIMELVTAYAATVEREARIDELNEFVLACELDDLEKPVGAYIQKRKAALQGPQDTTR